MSPSPSLYTSADVMNRYSISDMTLHRWIRNDQLNFPKPLVVNRRRFFRPEDIEAWERSRLEVAA